MRIFSADKYLGKINIATSKSSFYKSNKHFTYHLDEQLEENAVTETAGFKTFIEAWKTQMVLDSSRYN